MVARKNGGLHFIRSPFSQHEFFCLLLSFSDHCKSLFNEGGYDVVVTTYEMLVSEDGWFTHSKQWIYLIVDEVC